MQTELQQIELEIARTKLAREKLALQDDLKKRERVQRVAEVGQDVLDTSVNVTREIARTRKRVFNWMFWVAAILGGAYVTGTPGGEREFGMLMLGVAVLIAFARYVRR